MSELPSIVRLTIEDLGDDARPVEDYIEQLQQRNAELEAHVDRVKRYARESSGYEPSLSALYRMIEEETPQQSLNALKREVARDAYNQAIFDLWDKICTEGMSGKDVVCWGENSATQYINTIYPTEGE